MKLSLRRKSHIMKALEMTSEVQKITKVAAVDFIPAWGDLEGNIGRLAEAVEKVAEQGINYAVFPETAVSGYLFTDSTELNPYLDTIPGKATDALLPILAKSGLYVSVGIAERDTETGLAYNSAVLLGPDGIIGKYRKIGLNSQDQKVFAPGNTGVKVFETPIGRIACSSSMMIPIGNMHGWLHCRAHKLLDGIRFQTA